MKKIAIIIPYFGSFPTSFDLWVNSASYNKDIDFFLFTNQKVKIAYNNIHIYYMTLNDFSMLARNKLKINSINLSNPYKCCDFKPVYGLIFEDYVKSYDFWGHCDMDMIFGDLKKYFTDSVLEKYDKILPLGHLSIYRNNKEVNDRYKCEGSSLPDFKTIFTSEKNYAFDEFKGIMKIYDYNNFPFYKKRVFADIPSKYKRFKLALKDINYQNQIFYWENGHVFRSFENSGKIETEEFAYIHFQKRKNMKKNFNQIPNAYFIANQGFIEKKGPVTIDDISLYNKYRGYFYEKAEELKYMTKRIIEVIKERILYERKS